MRDTTVGSVLVVVWGGLGRPYASTPVPLGSVIVYSAEVVMTRGPLQVGAWYGPEH